MLSNRQNNYYSSAPKPPSANFGANLVDDLRVPHFHKRGSTYPTMAHPHVAPPVSVDTATAERWFVGDADHADERRAPVSVSGANCIAEAAA